MLRLALGIAIGWMMFDEQGKKFADKAGNKVKNISKDTMLKAKDALENVDQIKDIVSSLSETPEVMDVVETAPAILPATAVTEEAVLLEEQNDSIRPIIPSAII